MERLPPVPTRPEHTRRLFGVVAVLLIAVATVGLADRARSMADERRQAQVELSLVQASAQEIRAFAAEKSRVRTPLSASKLTNQGGPAFARLSRSVDRLAELGVDPVAVRQLDRDAAAFRAAGLDSLGILGTGDRAGSITRYNAKVRPVLNRIIAVSKAEAAHEAARAGTALAAARWLLVGEVFLGLLAVAFFVRRLEGSMRQGRTQAALRQQAFTDQLTGLPNRAALELAIADLITKAHGDGAEFHNHEDDEPPLVLTMALLDLDDLKNVNDSLGHGRGDELVRTLAARIAATVGPHDMVTRFGADEFGVLFADPSPERAVELMERVLRAIHRPVLLGDRDVRVTASAGIASGADAETIVRDADIAMYAAKAAGKDRVAVFTQEMRAQALANLELTADLRRALSREELFLEYQPIVSLKDGRVEGVEALVRWMHPQHGRIPPLEFIGLAERTGLIGPLGWWVMRTACAQMRSWLDDGLARPDQHVSVNVSPLQLAEPDMARRIERILQETRLDPRQLQLEITESVLVDQPEALVADLTQLMGFGVRIAIDDFGTGHSVLAYLKDLPVDVLKIDKAFVDEIDTDHGRAKLTQGIVQLAQALDLSIVAEGIETTEQADLLTGLGDMLGQGFLYSRPVGVDLAGRLLSDGNLAVDSDSSADVVELRRPKSNPNAA